MSDTHLIAHNNGEVVYVEPLGDVDLEDACRHFERLGYRVEIEGNDIKIHETAESVAKRARKTMKQRHRNTIEEVMNNGTGW